MTIANAESETMQLVLELPPVVAQHIRQQVSTGMYTSESNYIESVLLSNALFEPIRGEDLAGWMASEGLRRCEAMDADPNRALSHDEVWKLLEEDGDELEKSSA